MKIPSVKIQSILLTLSVLISCSSSDDTDNSVDDTDTPTALHAAFADFNAEATTIYLDGNEVVIETSGLPDHETVYWGVGHNLYKDEPGVDLTPSIISSNNNAVTIRVDATPDLTGTSIDTNLGTIGIAVSGASIFNDQEGNGPLNNAAVSLDWTGGHIGPGVYHYHLEPKAITNDDTALVGILRDGVFLYGRKDYPSNEYPTDLDASGGHFGPTPHNPEGEYHYHIINEVYSTTGSYIAFAGPYQGY